MRKFASDLEEKLGKDGFVIIEDVLSLNEVKELRRIVSKHFALKGSIANSGITQSNAAVEVPEMEWIFCHPKILKTVKSLLKQGEIMFTSHCDVHSRTLSNWHKDDGMTVMPGGYFGKPMYDDPDCQVYKVVVYLQDHMHNHAGLTVRKGSHRLPSLDQGEEVHLKTKAGDIVIFDVRLTHTGQRDAVPLPGLTKSVNLLQRVLKKAFRVNATVSDRSFKGIYNRLSGERLSIFFTYGSPNEQTINFAVNNMKRQLQQNGNANIYLSASLQRSLVGNGVFLAEDYFAERIQNVMV
jgi:hypothetical protein